MQGHSLIHSPDIYGYLLQAQPSAGLEGLQGDHDLAPAFQEPHCRWSKTWALPLTALSPKPSYRASAFPCRDVESTSHRAKWL